MRNKVAQLYAFRHFFWSLVRREFKVRYAQSYLGIAWMVLEPLLLVLTLTIVFRIIGRGDRDGAPFPIFFYSGLLPWNLFKAALTGGSGVFISDKGLLSKFAYPREISILKEWVIYFVEFMLSSLAFFVVLAIYRHPPNPKWLLLPGLLGLVMCFSIGLMMLTASINVYIRDVGILMKALSALWFWFTPIVFDFPYEGMAKPLYYLNPMVGIVKGFRSIIIHDQYPQVNFLYSAMVASVVMLVLGYWTFRKLQRNFVDVI